MKVSRALVEWPMVKTVGWVASIVSPLIALIRPPLRLSGFLGCFHHKV
jgi:hypothetical protein